MRREEATVAGMVMGAAVEMVTVPGMEEATAAGTGLE
jgi:hypothetical protein